MGIAKTAMFILKHDDARGTLDPKINTGMCTKS
jgi:hypothetical protein